MEERVKEKLILWIYDLESYEQFEQKFYIETEKRLIEKTIEELVEKILKNQKVIWNIGQSDVQILRTYLNINYGKNLTTLITSQKLKKTQPAVYNSLKKTKNEIKQEINKRRIMNMSIEERKSLSVQDFTFSNRAVNVLLRNGIYDIDTLTKTTIQRLRVFEYAGPKTIQEIITKMHSFELIFAGEQKLTSEEALIHQMETIIQKRYNLEQEISFLLERKKDLDKELDEVQNKIEGLNEKKYTKRLR